MEQNKLPLDNNLQKLILRMMILDESFLLKSMSHLKSEYFCDKYHSWLFSIVIKYYLNYQIKPSVDVLKSEIMKFSSNERVPYDKILDMTMALEHSMDLDYIKDQLTAFAKRAYFLESVKTVENVYNSGNTINAIEMIHDISNRLYNIKFNDDSLFNYDKLDEILHEMANSSVYRIPLGIPLIDTSIMGGLDRRASMVFLGPMNSGKSLILLNVARNLMESGRTVLFINLENVITQLAGRFLSSLARIPFNRFYRTNKTDLEMQSIESARTLLKNKLLLRNWYDYGVCAEDLYQFCARLKHSHAYDAIVIDYAQLLKTKMSNKQNKYDYMQEVGNVLASLSNKLETPVITAVQGNRDAQKKSNDGKSLLRMTDIADCFGFCRPMDVVVTITAGDSSGQNVGVKLLLDKQREGPTGVAVEVEADLQKCLILDSSLRYSRILTENHRDTDHEE